MPYRVIEIRGEVRHVFRADYASEAIVLGNAAEARGSEVLVSYPDDTVENTLAWFKSSINSTGNSNVE